MNIARQIAQHLLDIQAVQLRWEQPFTWSSGWKSPIYCDSRLSISYPQIRTLIKSSFKQIVQENYPETEGIAGVATAGVPQSALLADALDIPLVYVRSKPKGHGMENLIEGQVTPKQKVVVVEDIISTGGSSLKAIEALRKADMEVLALIAIFTYDFEVMKKAFQEAQVPYHTLSTYDTLLEVYAESNPLEESTKASLKDWRKNPESWGD